MTAKRRPIRRLPRIEITPEVLQAFRQLRTLQTQCSCPLPDQHGRRYYDKCLACKAWWEQHTIIHRALQLPLYAWPCLKAPTDVHVSPSAVALAEVLQEALDAA